MLLPTITYFPISDSAVIVFNQHSMKYSKKSKDNNLIIDYDKDNRLISITIESNPILAKRFESELLYQLDVPENMLLLLLLEQVTEEYCNSWCTSWSILNCRNSFWKVLTFASGPKYGGRLVAISTWIVTKLF